MRKTLYFLFAAFAATILLSCAAIKASKTPPADTRTVKITDHYSYVRDDTKASRENAERLFDTYAESAHIAKTVTSKRVVSINPQKESVTITYDFRTVDGTTHRLRLVTEDYSTVSKARKKDTVVVNNRKYQFSR